MATMGSNHIPLLVTMDLELAFDHNLAEQGSILDRVRWDLQKLGVPITVFATSDAAERFSGEVRRFRDDGHEIGCHGVTHAKGENFGRLPANACRDLIDLATSRLWNILGSGGAPTCFRGPYMSTSVATQRALRANGYVADFSVCAQRIDLLNARGASLGWLTAPRCPYTPADYSPYVCGKFPILVVPMRCLGAPFISALLYLGGMGCAIRFFNLLMAESRRSGAPIVYLFHSYEFTERIPGTENMSPIYQRLYLADRCKRYDRNLQLIRHMAQHRNVAPMTGLEFISGYQRERSS